MSRHVSGFLRPSTTRSITPPLNLAYARFFAIASVRCIRHDVNPDSDHGKRLALLDTHHGLSHCYPRISTTRSASEQASLKTIPALLEESARINENGHTVEAVKAAVAGMQISCWRRHAAEDPRESARSPFRGLEAGISGLGSRWTSNPGDLQSRQILFFE